jgi:hypothetical protein
MLHNGQHSDEDFQDLPNNYELYVMVQELVKKYTECKSECTLLKKKVHLLEQSIPQKQKISHEEYLTKHKRCDVSFIDWIDDMNILPADVKQILDTNYIEVVCQIIKNNHDYNSPICCLDNGNKIVTMIYNNKYWEQYNYEHYKKLFNHIQQTILMNSMSYGLESDHIVHLIDKLTSIDCDRSYNSFNNTLNGIIKQNL